MSEDDEYRISPLLDALNSGNTDLASQLLESGADPNFGDTNKYTPLHAAAVRGQHQIAWKLLERGASPNAAAWVRTFDEELGWCLGVPCFFISCDREMARLLYEYGANLRLTDFSDRTALHYHAAYGRADCVEFLLQKGCDFRVFDKVPGYAMRYHFLTPLGYAIRNEHKNIVKIFLAFGARLDDVHYLEQAKDGTYTSKSGYALLKEST